MPFPFERPFTEVQANIDACVDEVFAALETGFLTMPKGPGFIEYEIFEHGYQELKRVTETSHSRISGVKRAPRSRNGSPDSDRSYRPSSNAGIYSVRMGGRGDHRDPRGGHARSGKVHRPEDTDISRDAAQ